MSDDVSLKIRMSPERYIALRALANEQGRSMNGQVNHLVQQALAQIVAELKENSRGQNGAD